MGWHMPALEVQVDSNHIFFSCITTQFLWTCFREMVGGGWHHTNFPELFEELQQRIDGSHHIRWLVIGVLAWKLWTTCNKVVIKRSRLCRPADVIYKMCDFLQLWKPLNHGQDRSTINDFTPASGRQPSACRHRSLLRHRSLSRAEVLVSGLLAPICVFLWAR